MLSGGIDSTACIYYYLSQGFNIKGLFIDYGQSPAKKEKFSAVKIASHYDIKLDIVQFRGFGKYQKGEIKGRNAILVLIPLLLYTKFNGVISMGIHKDTPYYDCSESFVNDIKVIINGYTNGEVTLDAPFLKWNKKMVYDYCKLNKIPIHLTHSCEVGVDKPCGKCLSCKDRKALNVS